MACISSSTIVRRSGNPPSSTIGGLRYVQSAHRALQLICKRAPDIVAMECVKFEQPIEGYLVLLLDGQRVFSRLQLNSWTLPPAHRVHLTFEAQRLGITLETIRKPTEPRPKPSCSPLSKVST